MNVRANESTSESLSESWAHRVGHVVNGVFPLQQLVGSSNHSAVYLTHFSGREPPEVAIKLVPATPPFAESRLSRWVIASCLNHSNLLRLLDAGRAQIDGHAYLYAVMEHADQNLGQLLERRALTEDETREMLVPTLQALAFVHSRNFTHGQVKPSNILVVGDQLKLAAETIRPIGEARDGTHALTAYDPPEARSASYSTAGDMWALGVTLCEALARELPSNLRERGGAILPAALPARFRELVERCLSARPEDRPGVADVEAWLRGEALPPFAVPDVQAEMILTAGALKTAAPAASSPAQRAISAAQPRGQAINQPTGAAPVSSSSTARTKVLPSAPTPSAPAPAPGASAHSQSAGTRPVQPKIESHGATAVGAKVPSPTPSVASAPSTSATGSHPRLSATGSHARISATGSHPAIQVSPFPAAPSPAQPTQPAAPPAKRSTAPTSATAQSDTGENNAAEADLLTLPPARERSRPNSIALMLGAFVLFLAAWFAVRSFKQSNSEPAVEPPTVAAAPSAAPVAEPQEEVVAQPAPDVSPPSAELVTPTRASAPSATPVPGDSNDDAPNATPDGVMHKEIPDVPAGAQRSIRGKVRVSVRVIVNNDGTVFAALTDQRGPSRYFERIALDAAKKWTFVAAESDKQRLVLIRFAFSRAGTTADSAPIR